MIRLASVIFIVGLWELLALATDSQIIVPSPYSVLVSFFKLFSTNGFWKNIGITFARALISYAIILLTGFLLGTLAGASSFLDDFMYPFVAVFKATPVTSIILIAFFWFKANIIPVLSSFLMCFPVMFVQVRDGYRRIDGKLNEVCIVYKINGWKKFTNFTLPSLVPSVLTGSKQSLSTIWKVVVAAEVLVMPFAGIGRELYLSQVNLNSELVFAWTLVTIIITSVGNFMFSMLLRYALRRRNREDN